MSDSMTALAASETTGMSTTGFGASSPSQENLIELSHRAGLTGDSAVTRTDFGMRGAAGSAPISMDVLYQARDAGSKYFTKGLELLAQAAEHLSGARRAIEENDRVECASEVLRFEELLQPLFECRGIGEGFANVINTIHFSIANLQGAPLSAVQVTTIWRIIRELAAGPFLTFADSLRYVKDLRKAGLDLNSAFIEQWAAGLSDIGAESIR